MNNVTATLQNASLNIAYTESGWNLYTFLDNVLMPGTTYTLSCLYKATGNPIRLVCIWGNNKFFYNEQAPISDDWTLAEITGTIPADATIDTNQIVVQSLGSGAGNFSLKAIKLELGPTQTLAHQEGDRWVLNEIPDYGEQLRRCQRYFVRMKLWASQAIGESSTIARGVLNVPVPMRTSPAISISNMVILGNFGYRTITSINTASFCNNLIGFRASVSDGLSVDTPYLITNDGDGYIDISADL